MNLRHPFTAKTRELFWSDFGQNECWVCGKLRGPNGEMPDALHHILGRESNSPLNAGRVHNNGCHVNNGSLSLFRVQSILLKKTLAYLVSIRYRPTREDWVFYARRKKYYDGLSNAIVAAFFRDLYGRE